MTTENGRAPSLSVLENREDLEKALEASFHQPVVFFKHSTACGLSARAHSEIDSLVEHDDPHVYKVTVQHARGVSDEIEAGFGVRHESPQVLVVHRGEVTHHASHHQVRADVVRDAVKSAA